MKKNITIALFVFSCAMPIFGMDNKRFVQSNSPTITRESLTEELVMFHTIESLPIYKLPPVYPIYSGNSMPRIEAHLACCLHESCFVNKSFAEINSNKLYKFPTVRPRINRRIGKRVGYRSKKKDFFSFYNFESISKVEKY